MSLQPSVSEAQAREAYDRLSPTIRRWIRDQGWDRLRDVQVRGIAEIGDGERDVLISAATAAGKTEAAFLPVLDRVAGSSEPGLAVLYVSPLKALINDQFRRLDLLCERLELPLVRWHGDAPRAAKTKLVSDPRGIVLITPESIEALLIRKPEDARRLFGRLQFVIVDELHAFMAGARGLHLASLLKRIDALCVRPARRVGLSATIGDRQAAAAWLCPSDPEGVRPIETGSGGLDLQLQIRGYLEPADTGRSDREGSGRTDDEPTVSRGLDAIADHLFETLRKANNLVFGGSRRTVEAVADGLRRRSEKAGVPNEFFPHHGNLSKELREELEQRLKDGALPTTAVCTSTLELGIDIGSVRSVAQIGAPRSLAGLRQRLGRTGRREGVPAILRIYVQEAECGSDDDPVDALRVDTVRAVAAIRLLGARFVEPPPALDPTVATALLHQTLSVIAQEGGAKADRLFRLLGGPGPFASIAPNDFVELLRGIGRKESGLVEQAPDGTLLLGPRGEQLVQSRDFYALFESTEEWRLTVGARTLGTIPIINVVVAGSLVVFAGRRWLVEEVDEKSKVLQVSAHQGGVIPQFDRASVEPAHDRLLAEMRRVYDADDIPSYLDRQASSFLAEGRKAYLRLGLDKARLLATGTDMHLFLWRGDAARGLFAAALASMGLKIESSDLGVTIRNTDRGQVSQCVERLKSFSVPDLDRLASEVKALQLGKFDAFVPEQLLRGLWVRRHLELLPQIRVMASDLVKE